LGREVIARALRQWHEWPHVQTALEPATARLQPQVRSGRTAAAVLVQEQTAPQTQPTTDEACLREQAHWLSASCFASTGRGLQAQESPHWQGAVLPASLREQEQVRSGAVRRTWGASLGAVAGGGY